MTRASFRLKPKLKEAICDRAKVENRTQTDLFREAIELYLLSDNREPKIESEQKKFSNNKNCTANNIEVRRLRRLKQIELQRQARLEGKSLSSAVNQNIQDSKRGR